MKSVTKKVMAVIFVDIEYESTKVKSLLTNYPLLERKVGRDIARAIKKRMDSFVAALTYNDIVAMGLGKPHPLSGNLHEFSAINVAANIRLIYKVKGDTICVKGVCDYHGEKINWIVP